MPVCYYIYMYINIAHSGSLCLSYLFSTNAGVMQVQHRVLCVTVTEAPGEIRNLKHGDGDPSFPRVGLWDGNLKKGAKLGVGL